MHFVSTRNKIVRKTLSSAMKCGLAEDGGLFFPEYVPQIKIDQLDPNLDYAQFANVILSEYFAGDALSTKLEQICQNAFTFPLPLKLVGPDTFLLELFHGPTLSFKDFGARFLAECLNRISKDHKSTIIVATSGDTGSAVASAFYQKANINVIVLYPKGQISERQEHQIACWNENIIALAVTGTFDDCQRLVKTALNDPKWQRQFHISSANSINIGRLLPQIVYYAYSSLQLFKQFGCAFGYIVPTGNLGNATAAYLAKAMGFPIREIVLATNANKVLLDYLQTGEYKPRLSISTLANAMDVGNPSNFERLQYMFNTHELFKQNVDVISVDDQQIKTTIRDYYQQYGKIICPHTATACFARQQFSTPHWVIVATADASKFENIIEPIIMKKIPIAPQLQTLLAKEKRFIEIAPSLESIENIATEMFQK